MKSQISKLLSWQPMPVSEDTIEGQETPAGFVTREALYMTREFDDLRYAAVIVARYIMYPGLDAEAALSGHPIAEAMSIPLVSIQIPGMCGHYHCGGQVTVCLN
jgi:hypothetical protein